MELFDEKFWLAICFLIFLYLVYRPIKNIILKSLDDKIIAIKNQVAEAQKLNEDMVLLFEDAVKQIQQLDGLREEMLKNGKEAANNLIEQQNAEIDKFLESKKLETIDLMNRQKLEASQMLQSEFCDKMVKLVAIYMQSTKNNGMSDSEIAKNLMENLPSKSQ
ncbi:MULTISPECIES: F0F1 ATP synthase subunit B family protein [Rickettsieae]|jgi:F-type H+-transporting ATPase subunit b|uniref:F0F1 ATP synthase subunit B family protein n=1 Tax=Rickettsieae TaxID=33988 RepID=UPI000B9AAAC3|nr:ATP F0F1 synthase subunit B [Rickettsia endosymbiont of Culicoides newsteadi]OZG31591.1 ATP synthase subunit B [Rickettsia endosymbiont of Culicoides newsteadi]